ncbi:aspartate/glutamate racemase family protein [Paracoccus pacificus]|uniref:Aspartate/glutamate racemase family protein n=1 Tax=Paracoccus pacificus TaxID=1463598 RepID=A0ABW4R5I6_9RHOB
MRTIGILGGMSWVSTAHYYRRLNQMVGESRGGLHSAPVLLASVDFAPIARMQAEDRWDDAGALLAGAAAGLERAGAGLIMLATNTMHAVADRVRAAVGVPFVHIADATAAAIRAAGLSRPGLIATAFTMERGFYLDRLRAAGLAPLVPGLDRRAEIHRIIFDELCRDIVRPESRRVFEQAAAGLIADGADCLVLGCTEVGLLLSPDNVAAPVFDTVEIHCRAALTTANAPTGEKDV